MAMEPHIKAKRDSIKKRERIRHLLLLTATLLIFTISTMLQYRWMGEQGVGAVARIAILAVAWASACSIMAWAMYRLIFKQENKQD